MMQSPEEHFRASLAALAAAAAPLLERPAQPPHKVVLRSPGSKLVDAAVAVSDAVTLLDQVKFCTGSEVEARNRLLRAARSLRTVLKHTRTGDRT